MMSSNYVLVTLLAVFVKNQFSALATQCLKKNACSCEFDDGKGFDLSHVVEAGNYYLTAVDPATRDSYFFHPCADVKYLPQNASKDNDCSRGDGYALCRFNNGTYKKLGTIEESSFRTSENGHNYLVFEHNSIVTSFQLICTMYDQSFIYLENQGLAAENGTNLLLFSRSSCPVTIEEITESSPGKVLLILFMIGTFTYFAIGSIVRFMYLGARGIEVLPNLEFWKDLPGLVRDGAGFIQNGCRVERVPNPESYDAI